MANRERHHQRVLKYFIEATQLIIQKEGMEAVTIRKVAEIAGFNSATLYNYFQDLDQLLLYASLNHLTSYNQKIIQESFAGKDWYDVLLLTWEEFRIFPLHILMRFYRSSLTSTAIRSLPYATVIMNCFQKRKLMTPTNGIRF